MGWRAGNSSYIDKVDREAETYVEPSTYTEVFDAAASDFADENMMFSESFVEYSMDNPTDSRDDQLKALIKDGTIPKEYIKKDVHVGRGYTMDYGALARTVRADFDLDDLIKTDPELAEERNAELKMRREYRQDVFARGKTGSGAVQLLGTVAGAVIAPENIAAMVAIPAYGAQGVSRAMYSLANAKRGAAVGMATAAAVEPFIFSWRNEIDSEYTTADAMFNVAAAGILGGAVDGLASAIGYSFGMKQLNESATDFKKLRSTFIEQGLDEADADIMANFVRTAAGAPETKISSEMYMKKVADANSSMTESRSPDYIRTDPPEDVYRSSANDEANPDIDAPAPSPLDDFDDDFFFVDDGGKKVNYKDAETSFTEQIDRYKEAVRCFIGG